MDKILLINADEPEEVRVAVVEDGRLEEVYVEAGSDPTGKGNIYVGRVQNVERGIGAAFVDLGQGVTGFLHASDIAEPPEGGVPPQAQAQAQPQRRSRSRSEGRGRGTAVSAERAPVEGARTTEGAGGGEDDGGASREHAEPTNGEEQAGSANGEAASAESSAESSAENAAEHAAEARGGEGSEPEGSRLGSGGGRKITDLVKPGDRLLVQISRGPVGHKGPTLTTRISLPGRYVVLLANSTRSGVSRRIETGEERDRMRSLMGDLEVPPGMAVILRTASNGRATEEVQADLVYLYRLFENMKGRLLEAGGPRLVHEESDLVSRAIRDVLPPDATRIVTDDAATADRIREYLRRTTPSAALAAEGEGPPSAAAAPTVDVVADPDVAPSETPPQTPAEGKEDRPKSSRRARAFRPPPVCEVHPGPTPLFHAFGIEAAIEDAFRRTIRLPSGGSIVIDPTEALVAIDVNSGRLTEEEDLETTALKTDLEAVPEVARQLRLRDLGGVIVIDFIDLRDHGHMHQVEQALREALKRDRARIRLGRMGPFGCLELTRQRIRPALLSVTHVACPSCGGAGRRRHPVGLALRVLRELRARAARSRGHGGLEVRVAPGIAEVLRKRKGDSLAALEAWLTGPFRLVTDPSIPQGSWSIKGLPPRTPAPRAPGSGPAPATPAASAAEAVPDAPGTHGA